MLEKKAEAIRRSNVLEWLRRRVTIMSKYEDDFSAWTQEQAEHLRAGLWSAVDVAHVAEEIEDLGNEQRHAVESHLRILLAHLLKWRHQPQRRRRSWQTSILNARVEITRRLERNPGLQHAWSEILIWAYPKARHLAQVETRLPLETFPHTNRVIILFTPVGSLADRTGSV
jgi:hypothetical protein